MNKSLRVCYLVQNLVHVGRWARYLLERGHDVHVVGMEKPDVPGAAFHPVKFQRLGNYAVFVLNVPFVRALIAAIAPDVVHAYYATNFGFLGALAAGRRPFVVSVAGSDVYDALKSPVLRRLNAFAFRRADRINAGALHVANMVIAYGIPSSKIDVFPKGVNMSLFSPRENAAAGGDPVIICNRRFEKVYDPAVPVEAMPAVRNRFPGAKLIMIGRGPLKPEVERIVELRGLGGAVEIHDEVPHSLMPGFLAQADLYVSTSLSDGTSVSLLEAMAAGCFPVVTDFPTNREWITDGDNGFLVPPGRHDLLADAVIRAASDPGLTAAARAKNREIVASKAEESLIMDRLLDSYGRAIEQRRRKERLHAPHL
ncbi:MAG: glycosyltransferase family 4 protein [bacterium]